MDMDTQQLPASAMSANLEIRRVGVFLGARITGIDLTKALDEATVDALKLAHAPGQQLHDRQCGYRFAASRFTDEAQGLPGVD